MKRYTFAEMKQANKKAGQFWFTPGAMEFFKTRLIGQPDRHNLFITAETNPAEAYTLRYFAPNAHVHTVGPFHALTLAEVQGLRQKVAEGLDQVANREKHVLENLTSVWEDEDGTGELIFSMDGQQFKINLSDDCPPERRICG